MSRTIFGLALIAALSTPMARADEVAPLSALSSMPVKEVTVFKDGHALVLHEGRLAVDKSGDVLMDYLPAPVLGTFWPYSADKDAKLTAVVAGQRKVLVDRTSLTLRELLEGNIGAEIAVSETALSAASTKPEGLTYAATIVGFPTRSSKELEAAAPPNEGEKLPQKGNIVLLKTSEGVRAVSIDRIQQVTFRGPHKSAVASEEFRNLLRLKLDWGGRQPAPQADMGLLYVQKGLRWIPSYKFVIDGRGHAAVQLEATLINELGDLDDVTANLVIGVPSFAFADMRDPIGLNQTVAQLSPYLDQGDQTRAALSNAIMSQVAGAGPAGPAPASAAANRRDLGPEIGGAEKNEDLFIFTLRHVTLKKGQRMVVPVTSFDLKYQDVFTVDIGFAPPPEVWRQFNNYQQTEIAKLLSAPKAMHKIRLTNSSKYPITTAPALILKEGQLLGQGMTTYTTVGGSLDLPITTAVDILVKKSDAETGRQHNATTWEGNSYAKVNLHGTINLKNNRATPARIELTRNVLGNATEADHDGKVEMQNVFEDGSMGPIVGYPSWWGWYSWPQWWTHFNSVAQITWKLDLKPGESVDLKYAWSYYWH
ncbi:MAG: hypothetical protein LLG00_15030 [Planctomycetaceae bacterium]|nr:hypothetical protein [Planctomycetaceae bacterium]